MTSFTALRKIIPSRKTRCATKKKKKEKKMIKASPKYYGLVSYQEVSVTYNYFIQDKMWLIILVMNIIIMLSH